MDTIKFFITRMTTQFFSLTDGVVEFPQGFAFLPDGYQPKCQRFLFGEELEMKDIECEAEFFSEEDSLSGLKSVKQVRLFHVCDQYHVCRTNKPFEFTIEL